MIQAGGTVMAVGGVTVGKRLRAATVAVLLAGVTLGCGTADERAYSIGTGDTPLEEGLKLNGLTLPDCPIDDLRYAVVAMWGGHDFYLRFATSATCMESFLRANDMVDIGEANSAEPFPHGHPELDAVGWTFRHGVRYRMHHPRELRGRDLTAVVDTTVEPQVLSIYAFPV